MTTTAGRPDLRIDVHVGESDERAVLGVDVRAGLGASPKWLSPKWLYDDVGCALFERITTLAEYYPTRRERAILVAHGAEIARRSGADTLVELGSGSSDKTRLLLDALTATGQLRRFVPFEISVPTLATSATAISAAYPDVEVHAVAGDFERHPTGSRPAGVAWSRSSGARSAISLPPSVPGSWAAWPPSWRRATPCCRAPTW